MTRAGARLYKEAEVPFNAKIYTSKSGREFYLVGRFVGEGEKAYIRFIDTLEVKEVDWFLINKYII